MPEFCVTGGTGFIAAYLVKAFLEKGHTVRTTVRNPHDLEKVGYLTKPKDLLVEGSFDEAVSGVDSLFHTASPVLVPHDDNIPVTLIDPCIKGTQNVLNSCIKANVKLVVLTSSCSYVKRHSYLGTILWYAYAKTLGEKEAWRIAKESGVDLVVVNPSFVVGPLRAPQPASTLLMILGIIKG
ncbi:NAD(P)-binding Rossmann-fold superfamily protein [Trifolium repens]|nr:NAD(P)-binding Rossmann-fold superfamily protein [Trifolium repens]